MSHDDHIQHTWLLTRGTGGDEITVDLWTDNETVRVDGGGHEAGDGGRRYVDQLLAKYQAAGYQLTRDYPVNDPESHDDVLEDDDPEPDGRPEKCPDCGAPVIYDPRYGDDYREGAAWLCTGCKWGQWLTA